MSIIKKSSNQSRKHSLRWTIFILVCGLTLTFTGLHFYNTEKLIQEQAAYEERLEHVTLAMESQFTDAMYGIRGAIALDASLRQVGANQFRDYVGALNLAEDFKGVRAFGAIERVAQKGTADTYRVKFVEPQHAQAGQAGLELGADPIAREAIERAITTAKPALSGVMNLQQDGHSSPGFFYLVPVFNKPSIPSSPDARRAALKVIFYAQMDARIFYSQNEILNAARRLADFEIYDGAQIAASKLIFSNHAFLSASRLRTAPLHYLADSKYKKDVTLQIGGHDITVHSGSIRYFETFVDSTFTSRIFGIVGVALSILLASIIWLVLSARDRAESIARTVTKELRNSLNETRDFQYAMDQNLSVSITDRQGNIIFVNDLFCKLTGYSRAEVIGKNHRILKSGMQPDSLWVDMWQTISAGGVWRSETCNRSKDGRLYWVDVVVAPIFNESVIEKYISIRIDINAARTAQDSLAQERRNLQNIIMGTGAGTWELNVQSGVLNCNQRWAEMIGYTLEELEPVNLEVWAKICHPDDAVLIRQQVRDYFAGLTDSLDMQLQMRHKEGRWVWVRTLAKISERDEEGNPLRLSGTNLDISTEKHHEESLRHAMQIAQAARATKSQFLANMSHELRTPMNAILGMLRLLQSTALTQRQKDYTSKTEGAAKSLLGLLNDILDLSKIDAGKMELELQPFRVDHLMRDLSVILSSSVAGKQIEVLFDLDTKMPVALVGDALRLKQILINLGGNAVKFTVQGSVVLQIRVLITNHTFTTLRFSMIDTGIGIAPKNIDRIFEGFAQAEASTTRRFGGSGLGLSICKRLVEIMGGNITLESEVDKGSTFSFALTFPNTNYFKPDLEKVRTLMPGSLRVLAVDDNPLACDIMESMAHSWGWTLDKAHSGAEALALVRARNAAGQTPYQAIFMDWYMPEMDGWETLTQLKPLFAPQAMPLVLMVTAHGSEILNELSAHEQDLLDGFLVKPLTASMLFDAVLDAQAVRSGITRDSLPVTVKEYVAPLAGLRILLAEDNEINQQVACELLTAEGALVTVAANGQLALDALASTAIPFDAVLMDIHMPVMDGYTATQVIRQELSNTSLPIIAMTANAMQSDRDACLAAGMNDHIGKPFELSQLVATLLRHAKPSQIVPGITSQQPVSAALDADMSHLLDKDTAIQRLAGNVDLYKRILRSYLTEISGLPGQLEQQLQDGAYDEAKRLMHTIKGLSSTVGANYLAKLTQAGELVVDGDKDGATHEILLADLQAAVDSTTHVISEYLHDIGQVTAALESSMNAAALDLQAALADLHELQNLLKNSDMRAVDVHAGLRAKLGSNAADAMTALDRVVDSFDFASGVEHCQAIIKHLNDME